MRHTLTKADYWTLKEDGLQLPLPQVPRQETMDYSTEWKLASSVAIPTNQEEGFIVWYWEAND